MKVRNGFVSNSSTSSFMIYGYQMDQDDFYKIIYKKYSHLFEEELKQINKDNYPDNEMTLEDAIVGGEIYDIEEVLREAGVPIHIIEGECESAYLGVDPSSMDMDETRRQFQERVEKQIRDFVGKKVKCEYIDHDYAC